MEKTLPAGAPPKWLGSRGEELKNIVSLLGEGFVKCRANLYNAETNPDGCINLGTAENRLVFELLKKQINKLNVHWEDYMFTYNDMSGRPDLKKAVAQFLSDQTKTPLPVDPSKLCVFNGGGPCIEALIFAICDPGDGVMVATPYYGGINFDVQARARAKVIPVHFYSKLEAGQTKPFQISISKMESAYQENVKKGVKIRAVFFMNPNNPLGDVCTKQEVLDLLNFCHRHSLHLIMNEVYMNTIFKEGVEHHSVLSLKPEEIPDPQRVHFVWSASKDLSMSGMRFGVLHSWNQDVLDCAVMSANFHTIPVFVQTLMQQLLSDKDWLRDVYFPENNKRLLEAHNATKDALDAIGLPYLDRPSGLYIYVDFREFMSSITPEAELALFHRFIEEGIYLAPSQAFFSDECGWFRIVFSRPSIETKLAMDRLGKVCKQLLEEKSNVASGGDAEATNTLLGEVEHLTVAEGSTLENLLSQLKTGIQNSDWLKTNTADQWKDENPEAYKAYMENFK
ncbi:1-aminocyclopropane-1-carboxylate synthase-like protein 1 [Asterias rubens]|uniref:1-aminocyclopropane-1-carboxylate synthase-like protein 1 n=1 Tax=Asterias rubens TaxID=7604 RepID=UPI0014555B5D|nr:1-aminocyclopropane-1-carboxylate synthase-like protein 1 [Asterias rubens]